MEHKSIPRARFRHDVPKFRARDVGFGGVPEPCMRASTHTYTHASPQMHTLTQAYRTECRGIYNGAYTNVGDIQWCLYLDPGIQKGNRKSVAERGGGDRCAGDL
jgi:hypothetical protein